MGRNSSRKSIKLERPAKAPKYTHGYIDRNGKSRWYFRRAGHKRVPLPGLPWSETFMTTYEVARKASEVQTEPNHRVITGSVGDLVARYLRSSDFLSGAENTRDHRRPILQAFATKYHDLPVRLIENKHVKAAFAAIEKPNAANEWLKAIRALMRHAVSLTWLDADPTEGIKKRKAKSKGFHTWTEEEVATYEFAYPIGTKPRLALALFIYTAQRRSDVVRMGWAHVRDGVLSINQKKGGMLVNIPIHPELQLCLDNVPKGQNTFLVTHYGKPYSVKGFGARLRQWANAAGVPKECSAHGLRKTSLSRLADVGCTTHEIMAISGHTDIKEVEKYTQAANRKRLARSGMKRMVEFGLNDGQSG